MTGDRAAAILAAARGRSIVVVGDVMLDEYLWGDVARISPDAPVAVVDLRRRSRAPGGAANVALNLAAAGARVSLVAAVGDDAAGGLLVEAAGAAGIDTGGIVVVPARRTTTKTRVVARGQQLVRLDEEDRGPLDAASDAALDARAAAAVAGASAVVVSDYAKGVVGAGRMRSLADALGGRAPLVVDPKARDLSVYRGCTAITPNRAEAEASTGIALDGDAAVAAAAARIHASCGAAAVLVTRGPQGMSLWREPGDVLHVAAKAREVYDVTGAGDTVLAYFALALAAAAGADDAARLANAAAGVAVSRVGTTAVEPRDVLAAIESESARADKVLERAQAVAHVERERSRGRRIVFTNGCFDLLHAGHVHLLERAREAGDLLVVAVNSDASIRRLKGEGRPLVVETDRTKILAALDAVGVVVVFDEPTPIALIEAIRPDVLVKGGDYRIDQIVGADLVHSYGGTVATIPLVEGHSTTALVESIRRARRGDG